MKATHTILMLLHLKFNSGKQLDLCRHSYPGKSTGHSAIWSVPVIFVFLSLLQQIMYDVLKLM